MSAASPIYKNTGLLLFASCLERPFSLRLCCLFCVIAIFMPSGGALRIPCSPPPPRFWRGLCHPPHTPSPQRSIQVPDLLSVSLRVASIRWRWRTHVWQNDTRSRAHVNAVVLKVEALSAVISLSLSHWSWQRRRQPNLNKSFIAE